MDALLAAAATTCAPAQSPPPPSSSHMSRPLNAPFKPPSFLSPEPVAMTARDHMQRTLSEGARKKKHLSLQKRQRMNDSGEDSTTPLILKRKKKLLLTVDSTPQSSSISSRSSSSSSDKPVEKVRVKQSGSFKSWYPKDAQLKPPSMDKQPRKLQSNGAHVEPAATRRLEFAATPSKPEKPQKPETNEQAVAKQQPKPKTDKVKIVPVSESSSSSSSENDEDEEHSSASSDECEVTFDAMTLGNMRIIREAVPSPLSTASTASSAISTHPVGLEYRFAVTSTVSSIAVAPNGQFLVVGFYNGNIYLYPLTQDSLRFRHGVMLDRIPNRGMYTKLMVRVSLPDDGKFIFAGVYRGSTEIRAFEVDSIELPSVERLAQKAVAKAKAKASSPEDSSDSNSEEEVDDEDEGGHGVPMARAISHTYSDAKLKGFSDVKSVVRKPSGNSSGSTTEYHLLCGLGIKNIHLWRFYKSSPQQQWQWECIFDKQSNGISIEMLTFHQSIENQLISKSEHQNIRIWNLEQDAVTGEMKKKSHVDVKQTVDATAIYGDFAYGGGEAMALIDLRSSSRTELDLPLSVKEQEAKQANSRLDSMNARTSITASLRGRRSATRGRGGGNDDGTNGQRLMRMVSQVAGRHAAPFVVGMCTDGSVFMHRPQKETMGLATPLEYVEGYEQFFQDPSLSFQAQFSDLTRVNTSGLMAVLPLPKTEREDWMVVAANAEQLLVRSLDAFLHRNEQKRKYGRVKRGLRAALKEMGDNDSSSENESESDSGNDSDNESNNGDDADPAMAPPLPPSAPRKESARELKKEKPVVAKSERTSRIEQDTAKSVKLVKPQEDKKAQELLKSDKADQATAPAVVSVAASSVHQPLAVKDKTAAIVDVSAARPQLPPKVQVHVSDRQQLLCDAATASAVDENMDPSTTMVTTPVRKVRRVDALLARGFAVPSPVVSISSPSSASSNPNTPERVKNLSESQRQALVVKEFEWTPKPVADDASVTKILTKPAATASTATATATAETAAAKRGRTVKKKSLKGRSKIVAQSLFTDNDDVAAIKTDDAATAAVSAGASGATIELSVKRAAETELRVDPPLKKPKITSTEAITEPAARIMSMDDDQACTDVEDDFEQQPQELKFTCTPLQSDGGSLLTAAQYQYSTGITTVLAEVLPTGPPFSADEIQLVLRFSDQMQRLQKSYSLDRERIMRYVKTADCDCGSNKKKPSAVAAAAAATSAKLNWRKQIAGEAAKKKHMKRRHKKLLLSKLKELHTTYEAKLSDARLLQRLELQALRARLEFQLLAAQLS